MADFLKGVSNFFGLAPSDQVDDFDYDRREPAHDVTPEHESYDRTARRSTPSSRSYVASREEDDFKESASRRSVRPIAEPKNPEHVFLKPESHFQDRYSAAPEIGRRFRDGDIVTFDLSELDPQEQKRYVDFAAGLALALYGQIDADGSVITLLPDGVDPAVVQRGRLSS